MLCGVALFAGACERSAPSSGATARAATETAPVPAGVGTAQGDLHAAALDPDAELRQALAALERGALGDALTRLEATFARVRTGAPAPADPAALGDLQLRLLPLTPNIFAPRLLANVTLALAGATDLTTARTPLAAWVEAQPKAYSPLFALGQLALAFGHAQPAQMWFTRAREADPERAEAALALGALFAARGDQTGALRVFDAVLAQSPDQVDALLRRGTLYGEMRRVDAARADWKRAAELDPGELGAEALNLDGALLAAQGDNTGALAAFEEAARRDPRSASYAFNAGQALHRLGRDDEARAYFERARDLRPADPRPYILLGNMAAARGARDAALKHYQAGLAVAPEDPALQAALDALNASGAGVDRGAGEGR